MKKIITKIQFKITDWLYRKRIIFPQLLENKNIHVLDTVTLDYSVVEGYTGSICSNRTQNNPAFGLPKTSFIDTLVYNKSSNIKIVTNPYISNAPNWSTSDGKPAKKIRLNGKMKSLYPSKL